MYGAAFRLACILAVCASFALFAYKFTTDNRPTPIDLSGFRPGVPPQYNFTLEKCAVDKRKLWVRGWLIRAGEGPVLRTTRVVLISPNRSDSLQLRTSMHVRSDLAAKAALPFNRLPVAGFNASLSLPASNLRFDNRVVGIAYERDRQRVLVRTNCRVSWP